ACKNALSRGRPNEAREGSGFARQLEAGRGRPRPGRWPRWQMTAWAPWTPGPPGSGKTTVTRAAAELLRVRRKFVRTLELDAFRRDLVPRPEYTEAERELVYRALVYVAVQLTQAGVPVIVDATA